MAGRGREREERVESWERKDGKVKGARNRYICRLCLLYVRMYLRTYVDFVSTVTRYCNCLLSLYVCTYLV